VREENERRDQCSHFILRLAYCRTEDLRRWLLTHEVALFRHRLERLEREDPKGLRSFMQSAGMSFEELEPKAKQEPRWGRLLRFNLSESDFQNSTFYKIPFAQASDLIKNREVVVQAGVAYVPGTKLVSIVTARYRANLSRSLAKAAASFAAIAEDARIGPLLKNMNQQYTGKNFNKNLSGVEGELTAANVDDHAKRSMPLCMRQAHMGLKKDHKLKHDARRQYGLFLKGAGMSMEDSIQFFQREFTKIISGDDFNKNYLYNIRHMYGKEGKRQDYTPFSSTTIIMGPRPVANDIGSHHGRSARDGPPNNGGFDDDI
jgi:DNA primase large subunit